MPSNINDYKVYTEGMKKSLEDKLFFTKIINDYDYLLDYGCADGALIREFSKNNKRKICVGYDNSEQMISRAKFLGNGAYTTDFHEALRVIDTSNAALNLSSVIHEIYSYAETNKDIAIFWHNVIHAGFKYIVIRDLCLSNSAKRNSNLLDFAKLKMKCNKKQLQEFEDVWGSVRKNQNMIHFLMKYRYLENWNREVKENYFPISFEKLTGMFPEGVYEPIFVQRYTLQYTSDKVMEDFGIKLNDFTHVKMILERKY